MSMLIQCDRCKVTAFTDSRSDRILFNEFIIDGERRYHLCSSCAEEFFDKFIKNEEHKEKTE